MMRSGFASPRTRTSRSAPTGRSLAPPARGSALTSLATRYPGSVEQVECLHDRVAVRRVRLRAELRRGQLVFDLEHGLVRAREVGCVVRTLVVLLALLVDRVVEVGSQIRHLLDVVLEGYRQALRVRQVRQCGVEEELRIGADGQPRPVRP